MASRKEIEETESHVLEILTEEEACLAAILMDESGIDQAEFFWTEESNSDGCFRCWPFQWRWFRCDEPQQIDQSARSVGKSLGITMRAFAFPNLHPGQEMLITAPELVHLEPLTQLIERRLYETRFGREIINTGRSAITHRPFMTQFKNGARILGRIPQRDGKGVKGCLHEQALVWTEQTGYKLAKDIQVGDRVLTHTGRYAPVTRVISDTNDCYEVIGQSSFPMIVSCDHRFYGAENLATPKQRRRFTELGWHDVEFLLEHQVYWATPTKFPELPVPSCEGFDLDNIYFWWLVGRYLADGWCDGSHVMWVAPDQKMPAIESALDALGRHHHRTAREHSSADRVSASSVTWGRWLEQNFGRLAGGKKIPPWLLGMNLKVREAVLDGYLAGDGWYAQKKKRWEVGSASKELAMGVQLLAQSLGYTVNATSVQPNVTEICRTELKAKAQVSWRLQIGYGHPAEIGDYLVGKIKSVRPVGKQPIVNIVVDGDHSYLSGTVMSHNTHPLWLEQDEACFPAGTLILTRRGLVDIADTKIGDEVWTHRNRWRRVLGVHLKGIRPTVKLVGQGLPGLRVTPNHRLWAQQAERWKRGGNGWEWRQANEMAGAYWASPLQVDGDIAPEIPLSPTNTKRPVDCLDPSFLFLMGVWIAEGSVSSQYTRDQISRPISRATWSVTPDEAVEIQKLFDELGLKTSAWKVQNTSECVNVVLNHSMVARWLATECGKGAHSKRIPPWVFGLSPERRQQVLDGLIYGDGLRCGDARYSPGRWKLTTVSKQLLVGVRLLAQSLGYFVSAYEIGAKDRIIRGQPVRGGISYNIVGSVKGQGYDEDGLRLTKVRKMTEMPPTEVFDLTVDEDSSFVADGVVVHNSDFPLAGWLELIETVKRGFDGSRWRAHGVTRGVHDKFYEFTQDSPENPFKVHRITAMHRPNWTDAERQEKITLYGGSKEAPDYRRNILGKHGDATNPLFVLHRLMACVDDDTESDFNTVEYTHIRVTHEMLTDRGGTDIIEFLDLPASHRQYKKTWIGMDVGFTNHPSEILVFAEIPNTKGKEGALKLIARLHLRRISNPQQCAVIAFLIDFYKPQAFAMDKTGNGLPLFQDLQEFNPKVADQIKGYNFSEKILVDFDNSVEIKDPEKEIEEAGIFKNVLEFSTDNLRALVDDHRLFLPWDTELIAEFNGQTWSYSKEAMDMYGRRRRVYCVDEDTVAFSRSGWRRHDELVVGEDILTLNTMTGLSEWQPVLDVNVFEGPHEMLLLEHTKHSSLTTLDHRWFVDRYDAHHRRHVPEWRDSSTLTSQTQIITCADCADLPLEPKFRDDYVELVAWMFTEGHFEVGRHDEDATATIGQSWRVNSEFARRIEGCLTRLGGSSGPLRSGAMWCRQRDRERGMSYWRLSRELATELREIIDPLTKIVDPAFLMCLTKAQLLLFIETAIDADGTRKLDREDDRGYRRGENRVFTQAVEGRCRSLEFACVLAGLATGFRSPRRGSYQHKVAIHRTRHVNPKMKQSDGRGQAVVERVQHAGLAWCPTTRNGTWMASRKGSVYFTGNSAGAFHALDAARMGALAFTQRKLDLMLAQREQARAFRPVYDVFMPAAGAVRGEVVDQGPVYDSFVQF